MSPRTQIWRACLICLQIALLPHSADAWQASPDITLDLSGNIITRGDLVDDGAAPMPMPVSLGPLPDGADVVAYMTNSSGATFFVLAQATTLAGGVAAGPRIVSAWEFGAYSVEVDFSLQGVPAGVVIDALGSLDDEASVGASFDQPIVVLGTFVDDADIIDLFTLGITFDASAAGIAAGSDLDAMSESPEGDLIVSFDVGGSVGGVTYADEDLLRVVYPGPVWSLEVDVSAIDAAWAPADVDALQFVPEPGRVSLILFGVAGLVALVRDRRLLLLLEKDR
jgi:hypothetical protein